MKTKTKFKQTEIGMIPKDWEVKKIDEIGKVITGKTPSTKEKKYWGEGYPFVTPSDISNFDVRYNYNVEREVTEEWLKVAKNYFLPKDAVCFVCIGSTIGKICLLKELSFTNQQINSVITNGNNNSTFLFYLLRYKQKDIRNTYGGGGAAKDIISKSTFESINLIVPKLKEEQSAIAKILSSLDSKIELNQQVNKILEAIGQAIFKRWFVDFEFPNGKGKPYKSSGGEMIDSELGEIPRRWRVSNIGKELKTILGGTPDRTEPEYWNGNINWINSGKINEFRITTSSERITELGLNNSATKLLPKNTTVLAITGATLGQVSRLEIDTCANQSVIGILENERIPSEYIYYLIKNEIGNLISYQTGGAQQHINKNNVDSFSLLLPSQSILKLYQKVVSSIFQRISNNCFENQNLAQIRDSLLPKLMSGEIRVK